MSTLLDRCSEFYRSQRRRIVMGEGDPVRDMHDFVLSEIGRSPELENSVPLVLYFANEEDRTQMVEAIQQTSPRMISRQWP